MPLVHSVIPSVLIAMTSFFGICVSDPPYWVALIAAEQGSASASPDRSTIVAYSGEAVNPLTGFILATFYAEQLETLDGLSPIDRSLPLACNHYRLKLNLGLRAGRRIVRHVRFLYLGIVVTSYMRY